MNKILVFLDSQDGKLKRAAFETISAARKIAESSSASICGVILNGNPDQATSAAEYGLGEIFYAKHNLLEKYSSTAAAETVSQLAKQESADCLLFPANARGLELAPRVAAKLDAGYISDCIELNIDGNDLIAKKPVYAAKAIISTKVDSDIKLFSLRPNVFTATKADSPASVEGKDFAPDLSDDNAKVFVTSVAKNEGKLDVLEADIIVSGGRGLKEPENYKLIEDMAEVLGAAVGASRAVVDAGWRPHAEQVGQTGKTVSPNLYITCGISGAVQHLAGMSSSKYILAINKDKDAPIFNVADYGIVGDLFEVMPKLTEIIKKQVG